MKIRMPLATTLAILFAGGVSGQVLVQTDEASWTSLLSGPVVTDDFNDIVSEVVLPRGVPFDLGLYSLESQGFGFISSGTAPTNLDGTFHLSLDIAPPFLTQPAESAIFVFDRAITDFAFDFGDNFSSTFTDGIDIFVENVFVTNTLLLGIGGQNTAIPPTFIGLNSLAPFTRLELRHPETLSFESFSVDNFVFSDIFLDEDINRDGFTDFFDVASLQDLLQADDPAADYNSDSVLDSLDIDDLVQDIDAGA